MKKAKILLTEKPENVDECPFKSYVSDCIFKREICFCLTKEGFNFSLCPFCDYLGA